MVNYCQKNVYDNMYCIDSTLYGIIGVGISSIFYILVYILYNTSFKSTLIFISKAVLNVNFLILFGGIKINI